MLLLIITQVMLLEMPDFSYNFAGLANVADLPGLNVTIKASLDKVVFIIIISHLIKIISRLILILITHLINIISRLIFMISRLINTIMHCAGDKTDLGLAQQAQLPVPHGGGQQSAQHCPHHDHIPRKKVSMTLLDRHRNHINLHTILIIICDDDELEQNHDSPSL